MNSFRPPWRACLLVSFFSLHFFFLGSEMEAGEISPVPSKRPHTDDDDTETQQANRPAYPFNNGSTLPYPPTQSSAAPSDSAPGTITGPYHGELSDAALKVIAQKSAADREQEQEPATSTSPSFPPATSHAMLPLKGSEADLRARLLNESRRLHEHLAKSPRPSSAQPPSPSPGANHYDSPNGGAPPTPNGPPPIPLGPPARPSTSQNVKEVLQTIVTAGLDTSVLGPLLGLLTSILEDTVGFEHAAAAAARADSTSHGASSDGVTKHELEANIDKVLKAVDSLEHQLVIRLPRSTPRPSGNHPLPAVPTTTSTASSSTPAKPPVVPGPITTTTTGTPPFTLPLH